MENENTARLRIELSSSGLRELKRRAAGRDVLLDAYVGMVVRYGMHERAFPEPASGCVPAGEMIYLAAEISRGTKERLAGWSERRMTNLAGFAGGMVELYLGRFERDPRDLAMIDFATLLSERGVAPSAAELGVAIRLCQQGENRVPAGHLAKWLFSRLKPIFGKVERGGVVGELTLPLIEELASDELREG